MNVRVWLVLATDRSRSCTLQKLGEGFIDQMTAMGLVSGDVVEFHFVPGSQLRIVDRRVRTTLWQYQGDMDLLVKYAGGLGIEDVVAETAKIRLPHDTADSQTKEPK